MSAAKLLDITPDISCYAKLLTGGMMTLSATLAHDDVYDAFLSKHKVIFKYLNIYVFKIK